MQADLFMQQLGLGVIIGAVLSLVVAGALSSPIRPSGIPTRLLLAAGPIYLLVGDLDYQECPAMVSAAAAFAAGLYGFRGWWMPERGVVAAAESGPELKHRMQFVIRGDRRLTQLAHKRPETQAA